MGPVAVCRQASAGASQPRIPLMASPHPFTRCRREGAGDHNPRCVGHGHASVRCRPSSPGVCRPVAYASEMRSLQSIPAVLSGGGRILRRVVGGREAWASFCPLLHNVAAGIDCRDRAGSGPLSCRRGAKAKQPNPRGTEGQGDGCCWLRWGGGVAQPRRDTGPCLQAAKSG